METALTNNLCALHSTVGLLNGSVYFYQWSKLFEIVHGSCKCTWILDLPLETSIDWLRAEDPQVYRLLDNSWIRRCLPRYGSSCHLFDTARKFFQERDSRHRQ